jgi:colanic acid biosynthesis glycosyl transferase WcaI
VVVLDRFMRRRIEAKSVPVEKLCVVPPWSHDDQVRYDELGRDAFRTRHGLDRKFVVMFSGNLSLVHPAGTLLETAAELADRPDIVFCFVGGGNGVSEVRAMAGRPGLRNVVFLPYQPLCSLSATLSAADLHVVLMGEQMVGIVHPCKIYNILTVGKPFLYIGPSDSHVGDIMGKLRTPGGAYHVQHGDVSGAAAAISKAADRRLGSVDELRRMGSEFGQTPHMTRLVAIIEAAEREHSIQTVSLLTQQKE